MADTFNPLGITASPSGAEVGYRRRPLVEGFSSRTPDEAASHLSMLATWFSKPGGENLAIKVAQKSIELIDDSLHPLDRHFMFANHCAVFYRWRDSVPGALDAAIDACQRGIAIQAEAAVEAKAEFGTIPAHACYRQLRIIEEKRGDYDRAIALCQEARDGGWADDWDHHIARLQKRKEKAIVSSGKKLRGM